MRREAISLTEMVLETGSAPLALLGSLDMPPLA